MNPRVLAGILEIIIGFVAIGYILYNPDDWPRFYGILVGLVLMNGVADLSFYKTKEVN